VSGTAIRHHSRLGWCFSQFAPFDILPFPEDGSRLLYHYSRHTTAASTSFLLTSCELFTNRAQLVFVSARRQSGLPLAIVLQLYICTLKNICSFHPSFIVTQAQQHRPTREREFFQTDVYHGGEISTFLTEICPHCLLMPSAYGCYERGDRPQGWTGQLCRARITHNMRPCLRWELN